MGLNISPGTSSSSGKRVRQEGIDRDEQKQNKGDKKRTGDNRIRRKIRIGM